MDRSCGKNGIWETGREQIDLTPHRQRNCNGIAENYIINLRLTLYEIISVDEVNILYNEDTVCVGTTNKIMKYAIV